MPWDAKGKSQKRSSAKGAHYILAAKGNQKNLEQEILDTIKLERPESTGTHHNLDHARIQAQTINKTTGKTGNEQRIYISGLGADANALNSAIRKHWSVENNLH